MLSHQDIYFQSLTAPGLPRRPSVKSNFARSRNLGTSCNSCVKSMYSVSPPERDCAWSIPRSNLNSKYIEILSVNYDYIPMAIASPKTLWIDVRGDIPSDLKVGQPVRLHIAPELGIQTSFSKNDEWNSVFQVDDMIGSRIILSPYKGSTWLPTVHSACDNPFGWGYDMNMINVRPARQTSKYGYGSPVSFLEYVPLDIPHKAERIEEMQLEEDYYRGTRNIPGW
jgi:hypothetical protein